MRIWRFSLKVEAYWSDRVSMVKALIKLSFIFSLSTLLLSCKEFGVQGGKVDIAFTGIERIVVISPTSVKVFWTKDSKYLNYNIYVKGNSIPIGSSTFSEYVVSGLNPDTPYEFSVSGTGEGDISEDFQQDFLATRTYNVFTGLADDDINVVSATRIDLEWTNAGNNVTYDVFFKEQSETVWTEFKSVSATSTALITDAVTGLLGGTEYCIRVRARYIDGTYLPSDADQPTVCDTTYTDLLNLPTIYAGSNSPGNYVWFNASGGNPLYRIEIFNEVDKTNPIATTNTGDGAFRASTFLSPAKYDLFAIVKDTSTGVQARVELTYSDSSKLDLSVRNFFDDATFGAVHPPLINDGKGVQKMGEQVVSGDFNCDGLKDVAVASPLASPVDNEDLIYETGAITIYYSYDPPFDNVTATDPPPYLKADVTPAPDAVFPNPHLIHFPISTQARLGTQLQVGNFNGDCFYRDVANPTGGSCSSLYETHKASPSDLEKIYKCDDLVMAGTISSRQVFAAFGDPLSGIVSGSGGSNYGIDEYTCDAASSSCRSVKINAESDTTYFAIDLGAGDFNNDGYDDLLLSATREISSVNHRVVYVLRGSNQGITPIGHPSSFEPITTANNALYLSNVPTLADDFGHALSAFYNSRVCDVGGGFEYRREGPAQSYGYDFTKCDDVVIGAPETASSRGSIYTCKGILPAKDSVTDDERIQSWTCAEHYPTELGSDNAQYGFSLLSVENQNGYPLSDPRIYDAGFPDVTGALFVGAPGKTESTLSNAGAVYAYYLTPTQDDHNSGGVQSLLGTAQADHSVNAVNTVACDAKNTSCENQKIVNSPPQVGAQFGHTISSVEDIGGSTGLPSLAISAPYRDVPSSDGNSTIYDAGSIFLYGPDISTFGVDNGQQVTISQRGNMSLACTVECTWYSGGVSPFGPVVIYPDNLNNGSLFAKGGVVGGDFNADNFGDLFSGAEGYATPIESNGALFGFYSNDGNFSAVEKQVDNFIGENISKELNYRFENAKIVGDVNGDGYDDVISKIEIGTKVTSILYYGTANGLNKAADPSVSSVGLNPRIIFNNDDDEMGIMFHEVGSLNCDPFDDVLLIGNRGAYVYYGSSTGLITSAQPVPTPVGKNPLWFGKHWGANSMVAMNYNQILGGYEEGSYDDSNQSVGHGDFNGDGCNDVAIGIRGNYNFNGVTVSGDIAELNLDPSNDYTNNNEGRVLIIYGSNGGLQIGDPDGFLRLNNNDGSRGNIVAGSPCNAGVCNVQMIASPGPNLAAPQWGQSFGYDIAGVSSIAERNGELTSELLISDPYENSNNGVVYVFEGSPSGIVNSYYQALRPNLSTFGGDPTDFSGEHFGKHIASVGDVNGDDYPDAIIASPGGIATKGHLYIFYGGLNGVDYSFIGETSLGQGDFWGPSSLNINQKYTLIAQPKPQILQPINIDDRDLFANGVASVGDFNSDGFDDFVVNVALGDYLQEVNLEDAGMALIYFGSDMGAQIDKEESTSPKCVYSDQPEECAPYQLHLPSRIVKERSYLSQSCSGDVNGDGVSDLLLGARGRHHPSGQATATGVFYIMY